MTVKELIEKLNTMDSNSQVFVRFLNNDSDDSCWIDYADVDEDDVKVSGTIVFIDISNK